MSTVESAASAHSIIACCSVIRSARQEAVKVCVCIIDADDYALLEEVEGLDL